MGIFKKIGDLARSNLNTWLNQIEDKKKLSDQALLDLEMNKKKAQRLLVSAMASIKLAQQHTSRLKTKILEQKEKAEHYLKANDEENAKNALAEKQLLIREAEAYDESIQKEKAAVSTINSGLKALEERIRSIKSQSTVSSAVEHTEKEDAFLTFSRMEEKIDQSEREVEALHELLAMTDQKEAKDEPLAHTFDKHSDPFALEQELLAMKKKLND